MLVVYISSFSQEVPQPESSDKVTDGNLIYSLAGIEVKPEFPGGIVELQRYIAQNFKDIGKEGLKGKIFLTFIIEKDGSLSDIKSIRDIGFGTGDEAVRIVKSAPKWNPGMHNGQAVRVMYALPINYPPTMPIGGQKIIPIHDKYNRKPEQKFGDPAKEKN